jgi:hypothetical protein
MAVAVTCLRLPSDLSDAEAIIVACTGNPGWRDAAVYGLGTLAVVGLILFALFAILRVSRAAY